MIADGLTEFYPSPRYLILAPLLVTVVVGVPFVRPPTTICWSFLVFLTSLLLWRRFLRTRVHECFVEGRSVRNLKRMRIRLSEIVCAQPGKLGIGGVNGTILIGNLGQEIFVVDEVLCDERLRRVLYGKDESDGRKV